MFLLIFSGPPEHHCWNGGPLSNPCRFNFAGTPDCGRRKVGTQSRERTVSTGLADRRESRPRTYINRRICHRRTIHSLAPQFHTGVTILLWVVRLVFLEFFVAVYFVSHPFRHFSLAFKMMIAQVSHIHFTVQVYASTTAEVTFAHCAMPLSNNLTTIYCTLDSVSSAGFVDALLYAVSIYVLTSAVTSSAFDSSSSDEYFNLSVSFVLQCLLVAGIAAVAVSMPVTQEEYARYIAQQQTEKGQPIRRPVLLQVVPAGGAAYQPAAASPRPAYQQPAAYQPQPAAYQPQPAAYQPQPAAYQPQPAAYQLPQTYQQPEEYQQPEQQYQPSARPQAPRPKAPTKPKYQNKPEKPEDEENDNNVSDFTFRYNNMIIKYKYTDWKRHLINIIIYLKKNWVWECKNVFDI